jgi:uncharacterized membrane protein YoaK (UPF0700 family)
MDQPSLRRKAIMRPIVALLLSTNAGYVDTVGFLGLHGLFTAHVTGNLVTLGASLALGTSGATTKILALPVFFIVVALARIAGRAMADRPHIRPLALMSVMLIALTTAAVLAIVLGPFPDGDAPAAMATGLVLVIGMAIQNAMQRVHLVGFPPTTAMTGNVTELVLDAIDLASTTPDPGTVRKAHRVAAGLASFALGCCLAAVLYRFTGTRSFAAPPIFAAAALAAAARRTA